MSLSRYILPFFTVLPIRALFKEHMDMFQCDCYCSNSDAMYPRSLTVVNILGSQKCALLLDVP